jgi:hypothetical protein
VLQASFQVVDILLRQLLTDHLSSKPTAFDLRLSHLVVDIVAGPFAKSRLSSDLVPDTNSSSHMNEYICCTPRRKDISSPRQPEDQRKLLNIREHLGVEIHHLGSPATQATARRWPEHEGKAISGTIEKNALWDTV